jgi:hypothetical protein
MKKRGAHQLVRQDRPNVANQHHDGDDDASDKVKLRGPTLANARDSALRKLGPNQDRKAELTAVVNVPCNFPGLYKICRLHCSTNLLDTEMSPPPKNAIGFLGCLPHPPLTVRATLADKSNSMNGEDDSAPVTMRATLADEYNAWNEKGDMV